MSESICHVTGEDLIQELRVLILPAIVLVMMMTMMTELTSSIVRFKCSTVQFLKPMINLPSCWAKFWINRQQGFDQPSNLVRT